MTGGGGTASCSCWFCQGSTLKVASDGQQWLEELLEVPPQVPPGAQEVPSEPPEVPLELSEPQEVPPGPQEAPPELPEPSGGS